MVEALGPELEGPIKVAMIVRLIDLNITGVYASVGELKRQIDKKLSHPRRIIKLSSPDPFLSIPV